MAKVPMTSAGFSRLQEELKRLKGTDRPAVINVAAFAQNSFVIFLLGPPLLGGVAQEWGIRWSFGIGLPLIILSFVLAHALGKKPVPHDEVVPAE